MEINIDLLMFGISALTIWKAMFIGMKEKKSVFTSFTRVIPDTTVYFDATITGSET